MQCAIYQYSSQDEQGNTLLVYRQTTTSDSDCGKTDVNEEALLTSVEHTELRTIAFQTNAFEQAVNAISPEEVAAVYGVSFGLIFLLGALAYKVRVGKNLIKLM
jgi:hypothetical protein